MNTRLRFKASRSTSFLVEKTDQLLDEYLAVRRARSNILTWSQYRSIVVWEAVCHSGMIALGGWLLSDGQITLGQFVAAEVIVGTLLLNLDTVTRRIYAMTYVLTSLRELDHFFALPKHEAFDTTTSLSLPDPALSGLHLTCKSVAFAYPNAPSLFEHIDLEVAPGKNSRCWFDRVQERLRWRWCWQASIGQRQASFDTTTLTCAKSRWTT